MVDKKTIEVKIPFFGESVTTAKIVSWHAKNGDILVFGQVICDLETDKISVELVSPANGRFEQTFFETGVLSVNQVIGKIHIL